MAGKATFIDRSDYVLDQMASNCEATMATVAEILIEAVQDKILYGYSDVHGNPPHTEIVDTGALFDSIRAEAQRVSQNVVSAAVSANTSYAGHVHNGTSKLKGRPFVTDGVEDNQEKVTSTLAGGLTRGMHD